MSAKQEIIEMKKKMVAAIRSKNVEESIAEFADETVMFVLSPPLQFKTGENAPGATGIKEWFDSFENDIDIEFREFDITMNDEIAYTHCLEHLYGKRTDGSITDLWYRETLGLQKINGRWKITHQHQSVPMLMDGSEKAATDLKP